MSSSRRAGSSAGSASRYRSRRWSPPCCSPSACWTDWRVARPPVPRLYLEPKHLEIAGWVGWGLLAAVLAFPRYLYPLTWGAVWLIAEPLLYRRDPEHSLFAEMATAAGAHRTAHGRWSLRRGAVGVLQRHGAGRWIYTVPFLEHLKIFEMPLVGFLGFPFFALEVWSLYHLLAPHTNRRTLLGSAAFVSSCSSGSTTGP